MEIKVRREKDYLRLEASVQKGKTEGRTPSDNEFGIAVAVVSMLIALYLCALVADWKLTMAFTIMTVVPIALIFLAFSNRYCRIKPRVLTISKKEGDEKQTH